MGNVKDFTSLYCVFCSTNTHQLVKRTVSLEEDKRPVKVLIMKSYVKNLKFFIK